MRWGLKWDGAPGKVGWGKSKAGWSRSEVEGADGRHKGQRLGGQNTGVQARVRTQLSLCKSQLGRAWAA